MIDEIVFVIPCRPVTGVIYLLFYDDGADDKNDGKSELQYNQHFSWRYEGICCFKNAFQYFNRPERRQKEGWIAAG